MFQGTGAPAFNATFYLQQNPDVLTAITNGTFQGSALDHFIQFGQFEVERDPNQFFDTEYYLAQNPDVLAAVIDPNNTSVTSAFQHFVMFGFAEGLVRRPSAEFETFNPNTYIAQNPDLQAAFGNLTGQAQVNALFQHFVQFGVNEDRPGSGVDLDAGTPGITLNFTTGADTLVGSVNDDNFVAGAVNPVTGVPTGDGLDLISAKDTVTGGAGFDTVVVNGGSGDLAAATFTSVEAFNFNGTGGVKADLSGVAGLEEVTFSNSTASNNITVSSSAVDVIFDDVTGGLAQAINYKSGTTGSVELTDGSAVGTITFGSATANTITTVNVASSGLEANSLGGIVAGGKFATVNITGAADLSIAALAGVTAVNAAQASGDLNLVLDITQNVSVIGGSGDDRFVFAGGLTVKDAVDGGAGFDTVAVTGGADLVAASNATLQGINTLTNVERVEFIGGAATVVSGTTFTNESVTNIQFNTTDSGTDVVNVAGSARTYEFGAANTGDAVFNMKAGVTELNLALEGTATVGADVDDLGVNLTGVAAGTVATINLESNGGTGLNTVGELSAVAGSTIVITGDANLDFGGSVARINIDASGFAGDLTVEGSDLATGVTASATAAVVTSDVITLGSGDSVIELNANSSGSFITSGTTTQFAVDVISGFTAGEGGDVLEFTGGTADFTEIGALQQQIDALTGAGATLQAALDIAVDAAGDGWTAFSFQGLTYAVYDAAETTAGAANTYEAAADIVVQLVGVEVADLVGGANGNFAA